MSISCDAHEYVMVYIEPAVIESIDKAVIMSKQERPAFLRAVLSLSQVLKYPPIKRDELEPKKNQPIENLIDSKYILG